jgi:hypothetical protein
MAKTKKINRLIYETRQGEVISILLHDPYMELTIHPIDEVPEFVLEAGISEASRDIIKEAMHGASVGIIHLYNFTSMNLVGDRIKDTSINSFGLFRDRGNYIQIEGHYYGEL